MYLKLTASEFLTNEPRKFLILRRFSIKLFPYGGNDGKAANKKVLIDRTDYTEI